MRWSFYNRLKEIYPKVSMTYGYITKNTMIEHNLSKEHRIDALCISGNPTTESINEWYYQKKVRCYNRQIHEAKILKSGKKKNNQASYEVKSFRLFDKVGYDNKEYFIFGRRATGYFDIRDLSKNKVNKGSISFKKLKLLEVRKSLLIERRKGDSSTILKA